MRAAAINALAVVLVAWASACSASFSDEDVEAAKAVIRADFSKRLGFDGRVEDVQLVRESPRKLTGFAKLAIHISDASPETEVMKNCTATMGDDRKYIWQCE